METFFSTYGDDIFSIFYPTNWRFVQRWDRTIVFSPKDSGTKSKTAFHFEVFSEITSYQSLDSYYEYLKGLAERTHSNFSVVSEETLFLDGIQAKRVMFLYKKGEQFNKEIKIFFLERSFAWQITFYGEDVTNVDFNSYQTTIDKIIKSFHLRNNSFGDKATENTQPTVKESFQYVGGFKTYIDQDFRFSIFYPETWGIEKESEYNNTYVTFKTREKDDSELKTVLSFGVAIANASQDSLDSYYEYVKYLAEHTHSNFSVVSEEASKIDGMQAKKLIFVYNQGKGLNKDIVIVLFGGGLGWQITFSMFNIPNIDFSSYQPIISTIMDNFHVREISRGEKVAEHIQAAKMEIITKNVEEYEKVKKKERNNELRGWALGLIAIGIISIFIPIFNKVWGFITIGVGIIELAFPVRAMYRVNGFLLIIIGIINIISGITGGSPFWGVFGLAQIRWGADQFSRYNR